jgi:hypothetical protein
MLVSSNDKGLLAPHQMPLKEDYPLLAIQDCLSAYLLPCARDWLLRLHLRMCHAFVMEDSLQMERKGKVII